MEFWIALLYLNAGEEVRLPEWPEGQTLRLENDISIEGLAEILYHAECNKYMKDEVIPKLVNFISFRELDPDIKKDYYITAQDILDYINYNLRRQNLFLHDQIENISKPYMDALRDADREDWKACGIESLII